MTTALITGASSGIGMAIAKHMASQKYHLILVARREQKLEEIAEDLRLKEQVKVKVLSCDLSQEEQLNALMPKVESYLTEENLYLSALVNNAGTGFWDTFKQQSFDKMMSDINLNLVAVTRLCHDFIQSKRLAKQNYILNISSVTGLLPTPHYAVYAATKSYIITLSKILAYELKGSGTSVTCVCPGGVFTEFLENAGQDLKSGIGMMRADVVAKYAVNAMHKKRLLKIPGLLNKLSLTLKLLPNKLQQYIVIRSMLLTVRKK